ncbi:hypothetical protein RSP822_17115 [Ralstonia solanacearum]|nr:hypothetical protein RSP822_17115 [Ralstonia solanacearum]
MQDFCKDSALLSQFTSFVKLRVIVDANVILKDLRWLAKNRHSEGARPSLLELLEARAVTAYAPTFLSTEVLTHIGPIAAKQGLDEAVMQMYWCRYEALLVFVDVGEPPADDGTYIDPKDVPYIELQRSISAPIVSDDSHIAQMGGLAMKTEMALTMRTYARESAVHMSLEVAGVVTLDVSLKALMAAVQLVRKNIGPLLPKVPKGAWLVLIGIGCLAVLHPSSRKWLSTALEAAIGRVASAGAVIMPMLESLQADHAAALEARNKAFAELNKVSESIARDDSKN